VGDQGQGRPHPRRCLDNGGRAHPLVAFREMARGDLYDAGGPRRPDLTEDPAGLEPGGFDRDRIPLFPTPFISVPERYASAIPGNIPVPEQTIPSDRPIPVFGSPPVHGAACRKVRWRKRNPTPRHADPGSAAPTGRAAPPRADAGVGNGWMGVGGPSGSVVRPDRVRNA